MKKLSALLIVILILTSFSVSALASGSVRNYDDKPEICSSSNFCVKAEEFSSILADFLNGEYKHYEGKGAEYEIDFDKSVGMGSIYRNGKDINIFLTARLDEVYPSGNITGVGLFWIPQSTDELENYSEYYSEISSAILFLCSNSYDTYINAFSEVTDCIAEAIKNVGDTNWKSDGNFQYNASISDVGFNGPMYFFGFAYNEK